MIKLEPSLKHYLWGGEKLKEYGKVSEFDTIAESWEVSTHPDGLSFIKGTHKSFKSYLEVNGRHVMGAHGESYEEFPLLIKFIDAAKPLSIQVHPNDEYALEHEGQYGKTEMWYILEAEPQAYIYYGFQEPVSDEMYRSIAEDGTILSYLNKVSVQKGDVVLVESGTVHALGPGIVVCEIQQNSNVTYRIYDYQRLENGKERDLHLDQAIAVTHFPKHLSLDFKRYPSEIKDGKTIIALENHEKFKVCKVIQDGTFKIRGSSDSFEIIIVLEGKLQINDKKDEYIGKGDSVFFDANESYIISGQGIYLSVKI
ncbi:type I phosphomannose isomerase catalytic subunit [Erysipelothrix tonsillarum]|uniref:type I phosphomannose isomerase catalytic subunit n=1 Tax=Erysipelothrix tonsillarum TaxID=38402 RepID=UPI000368E6FA|nr:type I phosphomannose isomerase catalytic subunit [Erysipelothrix tonsillarum]